MNRKTLRILLLLSVVILGGSCSRGFKITGALRNLGTQNVRVVYATENGVSDSWIVTQDDHFEAKGQVDGLTVVAIYNTEQSLIARLAVNNGDNISISGDALEPVSIQVSGSEINEQWYDFIHKNKGVYTADNADMLTTLIETYVKKHPQSVVSTLLLMVDYPDVSNREKTERLLATIDHEAKPASIISAYDALLKMRIKSLGRTRTMFLFDTDGNICPLNTNSASYSIYFFWESDLLLRNNIIKQLRQCAKTNGKRLQIADISLDGDSLGWRARIVNDSASWKQFWAPSGPVNSTLIHLAIDRTPLFIVSDSIGVQHYRGISVQKACETASQLISHKN